MQVIGSRSWLWLLAMLALATADAATDPVASLLGQDKAAVTTNDGDFLKPDEAFKFSVEMARPDAIRLTWTIAQGYYLYRDQFFQVSTEDTHLVQLGQPRFPEGKIKEDEWNGKQVVFYDLLDVTVPVARAKDATGEFKLKVRYQGCAEAGLCYSPITKFATLSLPPVTATNPISTRGNTTAGGTIVSEQDRLAAVLKGDNIGYALLLFFGAGLLLSFTPCVLPMIPILSGIIVGQGAGITRARSFALAMTYVQGMALTYAIVGAIFVLTFKQAPQAFFQQPWIIVLMCALFIALACAMFGFYNLQLPSALQTKLTQASNRQKAGTYVGTFVMGALSALVVTACVAPAIIAALSVIAQSREILRGSLALYATGLGMGVPLLIVGASAGSLLPRAGAWMETVKQLFGVLFLGVAIYLAQPLLPSSVSMLFWATLAIVSGFWIFSLRGRDGPAPAAVRGFGLIALVYGIAVLIGALAGRTNPLQPLAGIGAVATASTAPHTSLFKRIKSVADFERELAAAQATGKPVMLDFYADWCVSCKEMEKYTFTDPRVQAVLANAVLLQADVTQNDDQDQALLKRFGIFGPPSIMFFGADGVERKNFRVVGYMKADQFATLAQSALL